MARRTSVIQVMVTGDATDLNRATQSGSKGMGLLGASAVAASKLVASSLTAIAGFSIRQFARFDDAMVKSTAIMGDLSDAMRTDMEQAARQVGKTTSFAAHEAAEAFFFLASAGLDAEQSIAALPKVAAFAQAGQFDLARATDLLTDAQSALGLTSDDTAENLENMARVSDVLVKANTSANASVEEFSQALTERAGAAMRQLGIDIEEGVAVLGVFADEGVKGSKAGTMFNTTLEGLTRTAREQSEAYDRLGVAVFDSQGEMRNMADIVGDLERAFDGMSTETRLAELASLGLTRQARDGIITLLGNADAIRTYEEAARSAGGTTEDVANRQLQSFNEQLGLLTSGFADVGISIGAALAGPLGRFVAWFREQLPAIEAFVDRAIPAIEGFVDRAVAKFGEFRTFFNENLREPLENFRETLLGFAEIGREEFDTFFERVRNFGTEFKAALEENDPEAAGEVLGNLIAETFRQAFARAEIVGDAIKEWAGGEDWGEIGVAVGGFAVDFVKGFFRGLFAQPDVAEGELEAGSRTITQILRENFVGAVIGAAILSKIPIVGGLFKILFAPFRLAFGALGTAIAARVTPVFGSTLLGAIVKALAGIGKFLGGLFAMFIAAPVGNAIRALGSLLGIQTTAQAAMAAERIRHFFRGLFRTRIVSAITGAFAFIKAFGIKTAVATIGSIIATSVATLVGWPVALFAAAALAFTVFIRRFARWNEEQGDDYEGFGSKIVAFIVQGVQNFAFFQRIRDWFNDQVEIIKRLFAGASGDFEGLGKAIVQGIISGVNLLSGGLTNAVVDSARRAFNAAKNWLESRSPSRKFMELGDSMSAGMAKGVEDSVRLAERAAAGLSQSAFGAAESAIRVPDIPSTTASMPSSATINVTVTSADPQAVVEALRRYTRANGPLGTVVNV